MTSKIIVYLGLGGNLGDSFLNLKKALEELSQFKEIEQLKVSRFYKTSPVGNRNQPFFINATCCFITTLDPKSLLRKLQLLEKSLGKYPKPKDAPRLIDIDLLFYGSTYYQDAELEIPHPQWKERLFVLIPLSDLISEIKLMGDKEQVFILEDLILKLREDPYQHVSLLEKNLPLL
jgi:2-amino-4-hydroxy-6-hydroxymethyldihydropteridine diphosphokinase